MPRETAAMVRYNLYYSGNVQGVGFRYRACRVAAGFAVTGYVRNLADGRVECVAEGEAGAVEAFRAALGEEMAPYIRQVSCQEGPATGAFAGFSVRR